MDFFASSKLSGAGRSLGVTGQSSICPVNHCGPRHQSSSPFSCEASTPLEPRSAGFSTVKQCTHSSLFVSLRISSALCRTICFHSPFFRIQLRAVFLSSQNRTPSTLNCDCIAVRTVFISCASIFSDISSNQGMESSFKGATLVLLVINPAWVLPSSIRFTK